MSILPAQFTALSGTTDHAPEKEHLPKATPPAAPAAEVSTPVEVFSPQQSTDLRIDAQHRVYYQIVNDQTGQVVCEIPSEQIRNLAEGNLSPAASEAAAQRLDVKS